MRTYAGGGCTEATDDSEAKACEKVKCGPRGAVLPAGVTVSHCGDKYTMHTRSMRRPPEASGGREGQAGAGVGPGRRRVLAAATRVTTTRLTSRMR